MSGCALATFLLRYGIWLRCLLWFLQRQWFTNCYCWLPNITFCRYLRFVASHRCRLGLPFAYTPWLRWHVWVCFRVARRFVAVLCDMRSSSSCGFVCSNLVNCYRLLPRIPPCAPLSVLALCLPLNAATLCFLTHLAPLVP
jgi:hypothetical protein